MREIVISEKTDSLVSIVEKENLTCGCCGKIFLGKQSPENDTGYGTCRSCNSWSRKVFFKARRELLTKTFEGEQLKKWLAYGEHKQNRFIGIAIEKGLMI